MGGRDQPTTPIGRNIPSSMSLSPLSRGTQYVPPPGLGLRPWPYMGNTRVINWGNTPLLLDLQTRCSAPGRSYTWTACDMRSTHAPLRTHSSALCNTGQHPRGRGPPPETRSRLWPLVFGLFLSFGAISWLGERALRYNISLAPPQF